MIRHRSLIVGLAALPAVVLSGGGVQAQPAAPPAAVAAGRPIPPAVLGRLLRQVTANGRDSTLPAAIAAGLGLAADGAAWADRQFAVRSQVTGAVHAIAAGARPESDLVLSSRGDAAITIFRIRRDGTLVSAIYYFPQTQTTADLPPAEAAHDFDDERVFWVRAIDTIGADE